MKTSQFTHCIKKHEHALQALAERRIFLIGNLIKGGLLHDSAYAERNAPFFPDDGEAVIEGLLTSAFIATYPFPALIDFAKTVELHQHSDLPEEERIRSAFLMSRINFMGTDGIRGKISLEPTTQFLQNLAAHNSFTPTLVNYAAFSFGRLLHSQGIVQDGATVVIGEDGRDRATDGAFKAAVIDGFQRAKLNVLDLGIVPTGIVPQQMLKQGHRAGAMLTASHNPANQNGIKFFLDGKKLLPEGACGDYSIAALLYQAALQDALPEPQGSITTQPDITTDATDFLMALLPENAAHLLRDTTLVLDTANGAFSEISQQVLERLQVTYHSVNSPPDGYNINQHCGVAELEGHESFSGQQMDAHLPYVKELFKVGRAAEPGKVFGIALDGDGDRGFLLYYHKDEDRVYVLDGDQCGYILAEYFIRERKLDPTRYVFVSTIESDIMTAANAREQLGLQTKIVSVGDKWIGHFSDGAMLLGLENSGHLIYPIRVRNDAGQEVELRTGIGLLTGLLSLIAVKALKLPEERILRPFAPGFTKTFYVFFVDKSRFYRHSAVWTSAQRLLEEVIAEAVVAGTLPAGTHLAVEAKEDVNVLYVNIMREADLLGCIFMRNSGTEDKSAIYVQGQPQWESALLTVGKRLQDHHAAQMKNHNRLEYRCERLILDQLREQAQLDLPALRTHLQHVLHQDISEQDFLAVLYGLKKEGRIALTGEQVQRV